LARSTCSGFASTWRKPAFCITPRTAGTGFRKAIPADALSLRSVSSDNFVIVDNTHEPRVIGETDFSSALTTLHEKAIYIQDGVQYHVERLDYDDRKAYVHQVIPNTSPTPSPTPKSKSSNASIPPGRGGAARITAKFR
jgi:ATP-dependent helicase YprA (DUF1998 family)